MNEEIRDNEIREDELEEVSGGAASVIICARCGKRMQPIIPMLGSNYSGPGFICNACGNVQ